MVIQLTEIHTEDSIELVLLLNQWYDCQKVKLSQNNENRFNSVRARTQAEHMEKQQKAIMTNLSHDGNY